MEKAAMMPIRLLINQTYIQSDGPIEMKLGNSPPPQSPPPKNMKSGFAFTQQGNHNDKQMG